MIKKCQHISPSMFVALLPTQIYRASHASHQVHACGGMCALVMVVVLGPRLNRFAPNGKVQALEKQSVIMQVRHAVDGKRPNGSLPLQQGG